jgi:hypothetical protein
MGQVHFSHCDNMTEKLPQHFNFTNRYTEFTIQLSIIKTPMFQEKYLNNSNSNNNVAQSM